MFAPESVQQALCLAKLNEAFQKSKTENVLPNSTSHKNTATTRTYTKPTPFKPYQNTHNPNPNKRTLTPAEFNEKRAKNMCFW